MVYYAIWTEGETFKMCKVKSLNIKEIEYQKNISELLFKMRGKVTKVKLNYEGCFENLDFAVCIEEKESQKSLKLERLDRMSGQLLL